MSSLQVTSRVGGRLPIAALFFVAIGLVLAALAIVYRDSLYGLLAILPLSWAAVLADWRWRPFHVELDFSGLRIAGKRDFLWDQIYSLRYDGQSLYPEEVKRRDGSIQLIHEDGVVRFPRFLDPDAADVYRVLWDFLDAPRQPEIVPELQAWTQEQRGVFGLELVQAFGTRVRAYTPTWETSTVRRFAGSAVCVGALWLGLAFVPGISPHLLPIGGVTLGLALLVWILSLMHSEHRPVKNWQQSMVVISPAGFAMRQGDLNGVLKWGDLRAIRRQSTGLQIRVDGASFLIQDIYDRPIAVIQRRLEQNWRPAPPTESTSYIPNSR